MIIPEPLTEQIKYMLCVSGDLTADHIARLYNLSLRALRYENQMHVFPDWQSDWDERLHSIQPCRWKSLD